MKSTLAFAACLALGGTLFAVQPAGAAVYVVAHPDDDILMMGPNLITDIKGNYKTVIIVVTAGDAGNGAAQIPPGQTPSTAMSFNVGYTPYYRTRLSARLNALATWLPAQYSKTFSMSTENFGPYFGSQPTVVERATAGNIIEYHLNLPDQGDSNGYTKMENLANVPGNMASYYLYDVTQTNLYNVHSLREIIRQIIKRNFPAEPNLVINYQEPKWRDGAHQVVTSKALASDHPDHSSVGKIMQDAIAGVPAYYCMTQSIYYGYSEGNMASPNYPNSVNDQRSGYEMLHQTLWNLGNIIPYGGDAVSGSYWGTTQPYSNAANGAQRQRGAMDGFHTHFYGRQLWYNVPSSGPCKLGVNG